jgi:hypothetical protein
MPSEESDEDTFRSRLSESGSLDRVSQASVVDVEARRAGRHQRQVSGQMLKLKFGARPREVGSWIAKLDRTSKWVGVGRSLFSAGGNLETIPVWESGAGPKESSRKPAIGGYSDNGLAAGAKGGTAQGVFFDTIKSARFGSVFNAQNLGTSRTR